MWDLIKGAQYNLPRLWVSVIVYSYAVIRFNLKFKVWANKIVTEENKKYKKDHEESLI